jgi:hypothetical protein
MESAGQHSIYYLNVVWLVLRQLRCVVGLKSQLG